MTTEPRYIALRWAFGMALLVSASILPAYAVDAGGPARITILDGEATLVDGAQRLVGMEGQALNEQMIIETGANTRLLRIEWPDGQAVDLGANTRAMLSPPKLDARSSKRSAVYLLQGWAKQNSTANAESKGIASPSFDIPTVTGAVTSYIDADETWLFAESGSVLIVERGRGRGKPATFDLRPGSAYKRLGNNPGTVMARPSSAEMKRVPIAFRDPLPLRYERVKNREMEAKVLAEPTYAELQPWLSAETPVRAGFVARFDKLLRNKAFRREIAANMRDHREWHRVLYPPKIPAKVPAE
jgi:hypothetical protein